MKKIHMTSVLICLTILIMFASTGIVVKWPVIEKWFTAAEQTGQKTQVGADPFAYDPPLPSYVKELNPAYQIEAELHTNEATISGKMTLAFDNPQTADLRLYLYDYPAFPIMITSIRHGSQSIPFERKQSVVTLANTFKQEKRTSLEIQFETSVPRTGTRFGVKDDIWTLTNWYPMLGALNQQMKWYDPPSRIGFGDPFVYHYGDYNVSFTSPNGYEWVTSWGRGEAKNLNQGRKQVTFKAKRLLNFSLVGSPLYTVETLHFEPNLTVDIASTDMQNIKRIKTIAESVFPTYIELYGALPYPHVAIAEVNTSTHAMEYSNLAIFRKNLHADNSVDHWLPHEIAHLWWYNSVETLEATHGWIDEGLVEMSVYYYKQKRYGQSAADSVLSGYARKLEELKKRYPYGKLGKTLHQFTTGDEFDFTWYAKGAMLYDNLRRQIGDEKYSQFMKRLQRNYHGRVIGPEHLDQALGQTLRGEAQYFVPNAERLNRQPFLPAQFQYYVSTILNGMSYYPSIPSRLQGDTVYLPLREVMEQFGYQVVWSMEKGAIKLRTAENEVELRERSPKVLLNGKAYQLREPMIEYENRTMVPLSFFQQVLKYQVDYDRESQTVKITVPQKAGK